MHSFLNPNGNKLVVLKVTILVTLLGHVVIPGCNFVETLKVLLTLNTMKCEDEGPDFSIWGKRELRKREESLSPKTAE